MNEINSFLLKSLIILVFCSNLIKTRRAKHSDKQICIAQPFDTLVTGPDVTKYNLCIQIIHQLANKLTFNWKLLVQKR